MSALPPPPGLVARVRGDARWLHAAGVSGRARRPARGRGAPRVRAQDMGSRGTSANFSFNEPRFREPSTRDGAYGRKGASPWERPKRIVLIRHAESEGNVDETMYQRKPDHRIELTERGKEQARQAGLALKELLDPDEQVYVYVSPYMRTMQTLYELGQAVGVDRVLGVREEPRIREQDFGNFQDATMRELKRERLGSADSFTASTARARRMCTTA